MEKGWILVHRKIRECSVIWDDKPFSRGQAWIDLLMMANHEDKEIFFDGGFYKVERGQKLTSIRKLSDAWGWSRTKTTKFLNELKKSEMVHVKSDTKKTVITIVNYDSYQDLEKTEKPPKSHRKATEKPQKDTNNELINNSNNSNNINTPLPPTGENGVHDSSENEKPFQDDKKISEYNFDKHTNVENVLYILDNGLYPKIDFIDANSDLKSNILKWMKYKDEKKPKSSNHYSSQISLNTLLNSIVNYSNIYGIQTVIDLIDWSIGNNYQGIIWDRLKKKPTGTNWGQIT